MTHIRDAAGPDCSPINACFSYPAPTYADRYPEHLGCPCHFDQDQCELVYDVSLLDRKPQLAHNITAALLQETCDRLIGQAKASVGASGEVYQIIMSTPGILPSMETVVSAMNMTSRTLRRRLPCGEDLVRGDPGRCALLSGSRVSEDDQDERRRYRDAPRLQRLGGFSSGIEAVDG